MIKGISYLANRYTFAVIVFYDYAALEQWWSILWSLNHSVEFYSLRIKLIQKTNWNPAWFYFFFWTEKSEKESFRILNRINDHHISTLIGHCLSHLTNLFIDKQSFMIHI